MYAILSDIHGNLEALEAVLRDILTQKVDTIVCLGDFVGYGPDPIPCLEIAMEWPITLRGNFEDALVSEQSSRKWPNHLERMLNRLKHKLFRHPRGDTFESFLSQLPIHHTTDDCLFVHGSPRDPVNEYIFPEHTFDCSRMEDVFRHFERLCFCGHTHIPGIIAPKAHEEWDFIEPKQLMNDCYATEQKQIICNVGSVGQSRDSDPRACYVLFDGTTITYRRIEYDIDTTIAKLRNGDDDDIHGDRLPWGR